MRSIKSFLHLWGRKVWWQTKNSKTVKWLKPGFRKTSVIECHVEIMLTQVRTQLQRSFSLCVTSLYSCALCSIPRRVTCQIFRFLLARRGHRTHSTSGTLVWSRMKKKEACIVAAAGILSLVIQGSSFCFYYRQRLCFQHMSATLHFLWDATKETVSKSLISFIIFRFHVQS